MHLTFDQAVFFSRADEARGKKIMNANELAICRPILLSGCVPLLDYNIYIVKKTMDDRGSHTQHVGQLSQQICMKDLTNTKFM